MRLKALIGSEVSLLTPLLGKEFVKVVLLNVEIGGIWIDSELITETALEELHVQTYEKSWVAFVPYSQIRLLIAARDVPSISRTITGK